MRYKAQQIPSNKNAFLLIELHIFINLLITFALAVYSEDEFPATDAIYYFSGVLGADDVVTIDNQEIFDTKRISAGSNSKKIERFAVLDNDTTETSSEYLPVAETEALFDALKTTTVLTEDEIACSIVSGLRENIPYSFYGYTVKAVTGADIAPSMTQLVKSGPKIIRNININPDDPEDYLDEEVVQSCQSYYNDSLLQYSLHKNGVVDTLCIPNNALPLDATKC
ncbi:MAG: hypothetical protein EZS28_045886, partial [Streblomastix strix]